MIDLLARAPKLGQHQSVRRWCVIAVIGLGSGLAAPSALAAGQPADADAGGEDPAVQEAKRLFTEGAGKFETADYEGAIADWTHAYSIVPNKPEYAQIKAKLIANLASAREHAYEVDKEVAHLNQAKILLESYQGAIEDIYTESIEREKEEAWVEDRLEKINAELEAAAARAEQESGSGDGEEGLSPGQGLIISGAVVTGLGIAGFGLMAGGMVIGQGANDIDDLPTNDVDARRSRFDKGRTGNALTIAGAAGGAVLLGTGVALLVIGIKKKKAAGEEQAPTARLVPAFGPDHAGLVISGRF
jgi:hypothetical protein